MVVKNAARRRKKSARKEDEGEGEGSRSKKQRSGGEEVTGESEQAGAEDTGYPKEGAEEEATGGTRRSIWRPRRRQWNQCNQWLEDVPFDLKTRYGGRGIGILVKGA